MEQIANEHDCSYFDSGVCGHPKLVGTPQWPGEVSERYCRNCKFRDISVSLLDNADVGNDIY